MPHDERTHHTEGMGSPRTPIAIQGQGSRESDSELRPRQDPQVSAEVEVRVIIDRTFSREYYFVVKVWHPVYRHFNRIFCDVRRRLSFAIVDEAMIGPVENYGLKGRS